MTAQTTEIQPDDLEVWESQTDGRISLEVDGELGRSRRITIRGKGSRLRILPRQRRIVQEGIRLPQNDPFTNGKLVRKNRSDEEDRARAADEGRTLVEDPAAPDEMDEDTLVGVFDFPPAEFEATIPQLSEFNVRRLRDLASSDKYDAKASQIAFLNDYIAENFTQQGSMPTYEELQQVPDSAIR